MTRCWCAIGVGVLLAGCLTGCETLVVRLFPAEDRHEPAVYDVQETFEARAWRYRAEWTPLVELDRYPRTSGEPRTRWTHPAVPEISAEPESEETASDRADHYLSTWKHALRDDFAGWNVAIALGQRGQSSPTLERLLQRVASLELKFRPKGSSSSQPVSRSLRGAAAEAWCLSLLEREGDPETVFALVGRLLTQADLPDEVRTELVRGLGRREAPRRIPGLVQAFNPNGNGPTRSSAGFRRGAIDACVLHVIHNPSADGDVVAWWPPSEESPELFALEGPPQEDGDSPLPAAVWQLQHDPDPYVRARYGTLLALTKHPQALELLQRQLVDTDPNVARSALVSLGLLGTPEAHAVLNDQVKKPEERTAVGAVVGLSFFGVEALAPLGTHAQGSVRRELALRLAAWPGEPALALLRPLLADAQVQVQDAAVETLAGWPEPLASRGLLIALTESPTLKTRRTAQQRLELQHGIVNFPVDADPPARAMAAATLASAWGLSDATPAQADTVENTQRWSALRKAEIFERLTLWSSVRGTDRERPVAEWFDSLTASDQPALEDLLTRSDPVQAEFLWQTVLPRISPAHAAAIKLELDRPLAERQQGARELQRLSETQPWPTSVVQRLQTLLAREPDPSTWRSIMSGLIRDQRPQAAEIARLALHGAWADVRILGCDYVAHHGLPDHATWVMPLFTDDNPAVQKAAITAAGLCRNPLVLDPWLPPGSPTPHPGLRSLLDSSRGELRLVLCSAMSHLGDDGGQRELVRMLHDSLPGTRVQAALAMGESGQTLFVEPLIRAAWTETEPPARSADLSSLKRLVPVDQHPAGLPQARSPNEAAELWNAWQQQRSAETN